MGNRRLLPAIVFFGVVALAACNSTTRSGKGLAVGHLASSPSDTAGGAAGTITGLSPSGGSATAPGGSGSPGSGGAVGGTGVGANAGGPFAGVGGAGSSPATVPSTGGPLPRLTGYGGVTDKVITLGIQYAKLNAAFVALGVQGSAGDPKAAFDAVIQYVNQRGGIAGRQVRVVYYATDVANANSYAADAQAACAMFTEDNTVFAAVVSAGIAGGSGPCVAQRKRLVVEAGDSDVYDQTLFAQRAPFVYQPSGISGSRLGFWVDDLVVRGFLTKTSRIGVVRYDQPVWERITSGAVVPALSRHGLTPTDQAILSLPQSTADLSRTAGDAQSAILRFRTEGIDRVLFVYGAGAAEFVWMPEAENQGYRPRYAITSHDLPEFLVQNVPAAQLHGAAGAGWIPSSDLPRDPGGRPAADQCSAILRAAGISSADAIGVGDSACEPIFFLKTVVERSTELSPAGFRAAVDGVGAAFSSPLTLGTLYGPGRYDGGSTFRDLVFDGSCGCFQYSGPPRQSG